MSSFKAIRSAGWRKLATFPTPRDRRSPEGIRRLTDNQLDPNNQPAAKINAIIGISTPHTTTERLATHTSVIPKATRIDLVHSCQ